MSKGRGVGARREMQAVAGRERVRAREVKGRWVSPRPCRRRRTWVGCGVGRGGGVMVRVREEGKSARVGRRGISLVSVCGFRSVVA